MSKDLSRRALLLGAAAATASGGAATLLPSTTADAAPAQPVRGTGRLPGFPPFKTLSLSHSDDDVRTQLGRVINNPSFKPRPGEPIVARLNEGGYPLTQVPTTGEWAVHPTSGTNWIAQQFSFYQHSGIRSYLQAGLKALTWLVNDATKVTFGGRQSIFATYRFQWPGADQNPWYSAFGQSHAVANCVQAWLLTGEASWLATARRFANAYLVPHDPHQPHRPWIMGVDADGYLWTDENPLTTGAMSGAINALPSGWFGLQTLYQITRDPTLRLIATGVFATLDHCVDRVRDPGHISWYNVQQTTRIEHYHLVNIRTFLQMYIRTGHLRFASVTDGLIDDYPMSGGTYPVYIDGNQTHVVRKDSRPLGKPTAWHNSGADIDCPTSDLQHQWEDEGPARWLLVRSGRMKGYWFKASPHAFEYAHGPKNSDHPGWLDYTGRPRPLTFRAGALIRGYTYDPHGRVTGARTHAWTHNSSAHALGRASIHGIPHVLVADGYFADMWVPLGGAVQFSV